jgi:hypothetical protein
MVMSSPEKPYFLRRLTSENAVCNAARCRGDKHGFNMLLTSRSGYASEAGNIAVQQQAEPNPGRME